MRFFKYFCNIFLFRFARFSCSAQPLATTSNLRMKAAPTAPTTHGYALRFGSSSPHFGIVRHTFGSLGLLSCALCGALGSFVLLFALNLAPHILFLFFFCVQLRTFTPTLTSTSTQAANNRRRWRCRCCCCIQWGRFSCCKQFLEHLRGADLT